MPNLPKHTPQVVVLLFLPELQALLLTVGELEVAEVQLLPVAAAVEVEVEALLHRALFRLLSQVLCITLPWVQVELQAQQVEILYF